MFVTSLPQVNSLKNLKKIIICVNVICIYILSLFVIHKPIVFAQSVSCAPDEIDTLSYMLPLTPKITTVRFNTGVEESYSTVKKGTSGGKNCFYIIKGTNFEQYCYDNKYIYFMQDTSWATGPNQDVMCQGTDSQATLSLVDPATNSPGAKAFNRCQKIGQNFTFDQKIVPINEDTCQKCSVSGVPPSGSSVTGRFERSGDFLNMFSVAGPGQGERRIFKKNCGLWGFQFSDGTRAEPLPGLDCKDGSLPAPENACVLGNVINSNEPLVLRDPASLLAQEGFDASIGSLSNYSMSCSAMKTFEGKVTGDGKMIILPDGTQSTLKDYCQSHPGNDACIFQPSGDFLASISENGKIPLYASDNVGKRNTSYMDFTTNQSTGDFVDTAAWYKFASPQDQCVQNINIMRAVYQICQTLPAISYKELVAGGTGGVLAATSDGGMCPIDTMLTTPKGSKLITDVYAQIKNIQDMDPNDNFKKSEDFCDVAYSKIANDSKGSEVYQESQNVLDYVKKVSMFRNVYEVGYIVYVRDFVPTPKTFLEMLFPFFSFDNSNRNEIPIQVQPFLSPYGLASKRTIESDKGDRPRDYVTGLYNTTFDYTSDPEVIREENNKEVEQIDKVQASYAKGYPDETEESKETCATYICCPKCKKLLDQKKGTHDAKFDQDTFKAILGAYINKNIEAGTASTFNTRIGLQNNEGLSGSFNTCRVSQKDINGETAKKLGSSLVQESIYPSIVQSVFNFLGIIKVGGAGASPDNTTSIRVFVVSPDEARSLQTSEGNKVAKFLNPDYIDYMNKTFKDVEEGKITNAKNPILQMYGIDQGFNSNDDSRDYDKPGSGATPPPNASPTPTPQVEVVGGIKLKEEQPKDGEGGVVAGGMFGRELFTLLGNILSAPDSPTYSSEYTTFEDYWSGKNKQETGL